MKLDFTDYTKSYTQHSLRKNKQRLRKNGNLQKNIKSNFNMNDQKTKNRIIIPCRRLQVNQLDIPSCRLFTIGYFSCNRIRLSELSPAITSSCTLERESALNALSFRVLISFKLNLTWTNLRNMSRYCSTESSFPFSANWSISRFIVYNQHGMINEEFVTGSFLRCNSTVPQHVCMDVHLQWEGRRDEDESPL